jgi:glycoside/pentoside/hexuronide:cation symporter, GPH family
MMSTGVSRRAAVLYAAPAAGVYFFYLPMWGILPAVYTTYFGIQLTTMGAILLFVRVFDGIVDVAVGQLSDWRRARGGSRKSWVIVGGLCTIVACHFLFRPPAEVTWSYYLWCSLAYFVAFTISEIPHLAWGSELTFDYQGRARIFGARNIVIQLGTILFYLVPLLPLYASTTYTPEVLRDAVYVGAALTIVGVLTAIRAPVGAIVRTEPSDSPRKLLDSVLDNKPLCALTAAIALWGIGFGMWFALVYIYLNSYLSIGRHFALIFLLSAVWSMIITPVWIKVIQMTSKSAVWAIGVVIFLAQLLLTFLAGPSNPWLVACSIVLVFPCLPVTYNIAAPAILGDIVDYGKWKFRKDRGAVYFALKSLVFKVTVGIGGGLSLGIAGLFGFDPSKTVHSDSAIAGLQIGFILLPACACAASLYFIRRIAIDRRRHGIIQRRLSSRIGLVGRGGEERVSAHP